MPSQATETHRYIGSDNSEVPSVEGVGWDLALVKLHQLHTPTVTTIHTAQLHCFMINLCRDAKPMNIPHTSLWAENSAVFSKWEDSSFYCLPMATAKKSSNHSHTQQMPPYEQQPYLGRDANSSQRIIILGLKTLRYPLKEGEEKIIPVLQILDLLKNTVTYVTT